MKSALALPRITAHFDEILLRTLPHTLLEPADLRAVSKHLGHDAFRGYKEGHFRAALAWVEHWERSFCFSDPSDPIARLHVKGLRIGIDHGQNGTVRRVVMRLANSVSRSNVNLQGTVSSNPAGGPTLVGASKGKSNNRDVAVDQASVQLARQALHDRHMKNLPGIVTKFCYFADSYVPQEKQFADLSLKDRYGEAATNIVQREAFRQSVAEFLNAPMTDLIREYVSDDRANAWMSRRVAACCLAVLPSPIALLTWARTEAFLRAAETGQAGVSTFSTSGA